MTVGQEFGAFAVTLREELSRLADSRTLLCEVNLGATAIGTGITAHPDTGAVPSRTSPRSPGTRSSAPATSSRPPWTSVRSSSSPECSSASS